MRSPGAHAALGTFKAGSPDWPCDETPPFSSVARFPERDDLETASRSFNPRVVATVSTSCWRILLKRGSSPALSSNYWPGQIAWGGVRS